MGKVEKNAVFSCYCALSYNMASNFNAIGILEVKVIW